MAIHSPSISVAIDRLRDHGYFDNDYICAIYEDWKRLVFRGKDGYHKGIIYTENKHEPVELHPIQNYYFLDRYLYDDYD